MKELTFCNVMKSFDMTSKHYKEFIEKNSDGGPFWKQAIERAILNGKNNDVFSSLSITNVIDKQTHYVIQFTIYLYNERYKPYNISKSFWLNKQ